MKEIRWHARGGQGIKTASKLFAKIVFELGYNVQGFPEYGPERTGAPITAYNRFSKKKINVFSNIYNPDIVIVSDISLFSVINVFSGIKENTILIINTSEEISETVKEKIRESNINEVWIIPASEISKQVFGKSYPNMSLLSACIKILNISEEKEFYDLAEKNLKEIFEDKEKICELNLEVIKKAYNMTKRIGG